MQLLGAVLRNFYEIGTVVNKSDVTDLKFPLKVPHYQRPYKWTNNEISNLIKDWKSNLSIETTNRSNSNKYFAGSVVSVAAPDAKFHSLIDGQQRITTLFLANFIKFIFLRRLILADIDKKRCGKLQKYNDKLAETVKYIFTDNHTLSHFELAVEELNKISDDEEMESLHKQKNYIKKYQDLLWIPSFSSKQQYEDDTRNLMIKKLENVDFYLKYDRFSFNEILKKVLAQFLIGFGDTTELYTCNLNESILNENEKIYANALSTIVSIFKESFPKDETTEDIYRYVHSLYEKLDNFLQDINVCVIQTADTDDAYTLFEVMNDRALALDDLDLIKNQFFKKFVMTNKCLDDSKVDQIIQKLDDQWGDQIFNHKSMNQTYKKLVTYLATVFITGNTDLVNQANEKYRIELAKYLEKKTVYSEKDIQRDFNIFETCFEILKEAKLPLKLKDSCAIVSQYNNDTNFKKSLYFLNALNQNGVISGLINYTLSSIENVNANFEISQCKDFTKLLFQKNREIIGHEESLLDLLKNIENQANNLWKSSLLSKSADLPRALSKQIIIDNHLRSSRDHLLEVKTINEKEHYNQFGEWLEKWQYNSNSTFKVKVLFSVLLNYDLDIDTDKVTAKKFGLEIKDKEISDKIELDHLVAQNLGEPSIMDFEHNDREMFINGLGNMMLLPKAENIDKSNAPLENAMHFYEKIGLENYFLVRKIRDDLTKVKNANITPEAFLRQRKDYLIKYFKQMLQD